MKDDLTMTWQPIATAPKDGTPVQLWRPPAAVGRWSCRIHAKWHAFEDGGVWVWPSEGYYNIEDTDWIDTGEFFETVDEFTHWMPLPPPPEPTP